MISQILQDLQVKGSTPLPPDASNTDKFKDMSLSDIASVSACAYQMFICNLCGFGVPIDLDKAMQYLKTSAYGGYVMALVTLSSFQNLDMDPLFAKEAHIQAVLETVVSSGPRFGIILWLSACRTLRHNNMEAYQNAVMKLNKSGYAELGEAFDCSSEVDAETFRGVSVDFLWIARGTMPLVLRLIPLLSAQQFIMCFKNGCLPCGSVNYNNETALYMCCRAGDKGKVLALLSTFEWARAQVSTANKQGRLPLHWLWAFDRHDVEAVAEALLFHGADVDAVDDMNFRALDYAIVAHREDVVSVLLTKSKLSFRIFFDKY